MEKGNNIIPNFNKKWQTRVRTQFNQPAIKCRREKNRMAKAYVVAPKPMNLLRPVVRQKLEQEKEKVLGIKNQSHRKKQNLAFGFS
ncbi:hypothetical protein E2986_14151 [Frieseomelitta varia]|uniref:Large ribosomal subunit protein eL13 n=1 Tax=Frieseomelitta varia TaxID=561572 RepID=A0A833VW99_9HYME|nr:hypothetical protein E2986_14151 [Frieseomelitta varia]